MTRWLISILAILIVSIAEVHALEFNSLPGSTWGRFSHDEDRLVGTGSMGFLNQGVDWTTLPGGVVVNTFVEFRWRVRDQNNRFYNAYSHALGLEFRKPPFRFGVNYLWERFPEITESSNKLQYFTTWFYSWDLNRKLLYLIKGLPGSTWGRFSHDEDRLVGTGSMGFLNQGVDWTTLPGGVVVNTFVEFRWRVRDQNNRFYNAYSHALGLEFRKPPFRFGVNHLRERFPELNETSSKVQYFMTWFYGWDLQ
ncbi:MAG: hypothetical protein ACE5FZ_04765 [Nitrospiria bacterium]